VSRGKGELAVAALAAMLLFCLPYCAATAATLTITGTVLTPDGEPAAGASVFAEWYFVKGPRDYSTVKAETTSAEDGSFTLVLEGEGEPIEQWAVGVVKEGYGLGWTRVNSAEADNVLLRLNEEAVITGIVRDDAGEPIAGADVGMAGAVGEDRGDVIYAIQRFKTTTGNDGRFELPGMPGGKKVRLYVNADGCVTEHTSEKPAELMKDLEITLHPEAAIAGRVARNGEPVSGVTVWCKARPPAYKRGAGGTDQDGRYVARGMPGGVYDVYLEAPEGWTATPHRNITCVAGETVDDINFELIEGGLVAGTVRDRVTEEIVAGATVGAYVSQSEFPFSGLWHTGSDEEGHYRLRLPPGEYLLHVDGRGQGYAYRGEEPWLHKVEIVAAETIESFDILVTPEAKLAGVVVDSTGDPVAGAEVGVSDFNMSATSDEQGRFEGDLRSKRFPLEVFAFHQERGLVGRLLLREYALEVEVVMKPGSYVKTRLVDADGNGLPAVRVTCTYTVWRGDRTGSVVYAPKQDTDADGRVRVGPLPAGVKLEIYIHGKEARYIAESDWLEEFVLEPEEERDLGTATVDMAGQSIRGRVMDAERNPVEGCIVVDLQSEAMARTNELGVFEITGLPYRDVRSSPPQSYEAVLIAVHPDLKLYATEVKMDPDWGFEAHMVLEPLGSIKGRLLDEEGRPIAKQRVKLTATDIPYVAWPDALSAHRYEAKLRAETTTDGDGRWSFDGLLPGFDYYVTARDSDDGRTLSLFYERVATEPGATIDLGDITRGHDGE